MAPENLNGEIQLVKQARETGFYKKITFENGLGCVASQNMHQQHVQETWRQELLSFKFKYQP
jgi:hypothetical protein